MKKKNFWKKSLISVGLLVLPMIVGLTLLSAERVQGADEDRLTFTVRADDLIIDVLESGSIESSNSQVIKCEVEGRTTIISIVPEGTVLTEEDVEKETVLVELDSSDMRERETQQDIQVQTALASLTDASSAYEIQIKQNESNLKQGELKAKFSFMDLQKYLGEKASEQYAEGKIELENLVGSDLLGGEALQKRRNLESDIELAQEDIARASEKLDWTIKLYHKGYVTRNEKQVDELALKRQGIQLEKAGTALDLFKRYEFPKQTEKLWSDYEEALRELDRIKARNESEIAKAEVRLKTNEAKYRQQSERLEKLREQIEKSIIRATQPGLVVYAGSDQPWRSNKIEEGAQVHERQEILKIPNTTTMVVKAQVHESVITRIQEGQRTLVTVDAIPDYQFSGKVSKVGVIPDSSNRWWNPDRKVYLTDITIDEATSALKPGMSAQVRIIINELEDVLIVPIQAVTSFGDDAICFVQTGSDPERRVVTVGDYNDKFIQIVSGLKAGEKVLLNPGDLKDSLKPTLQQQRDAIVNAPELEKDKKSADEKPDKPAKDEKKPEPKEAKGQPMQRPPQRS